MVAQAPQKFLSSQSLGAPMVGRPDAISADRLSIINNIFPDSGIEWLASRVIGVWGAVDLGGVVF
jgi:hypothetical protein